MAAVLCEGVRLGCKGFCECLDCVVKAPCRLCGTVCEGCGNCCRNSCEAVSSCCKNSCGWVGNLCSNSLCFYLVVALGLNIPPIVLGIVDAANGNIGSCQGSTWLLVDWILCVIHILAALYMVFQVQRKDNESFFAWGESNSVKNLLCHDPVVALYILILIGFFVWLVLGAVWFGLAGDNEDGVDECDDEGTGQRVVLALSFGVAFLAIGGCAISMSLCCNICGRSK